MKEAYLGSSSMSPELSIVIPALNEGEYLRRTVESVLDTGPSEIELIVVDDGSQDGCADFLRKGGFPVSLLEPSTPGARVGAAEARNKGARVATAEVVVFADAHVIFSQGWAEAFKAVLENPSVGAAAPAISVLGRPENQGFGMRWINSELAIEWLPPRADAPYEAPLLPGACMAVRRAVFEECGGFDGGLVRWGFEDAELSFRIWSSGFDLCIVPNIDVSHLFRTEHPYEIDWADLVHNMLRVAWIHFSESRLARVIDKLKRGDRFTAAVTRLAGGDASYRRIALHARRPRSDDQYFRKFGDII
jgi:GT2 family glycosyltransferase